MILLKRLAGAFFALIDTRDALGAMKLALRTLDAVSVRTRAFIGIILAVFA